MRGLNDSSGFGPDLYFEWLCHKVGMGPEKRYFTLARALHEMIFEPKNVVGNDKNRAQDGLELRVEFMDRYGAQGSALNRGPCSMFEFLVGLARRMSFIMCDGEEDISAKTGHYFWKLIENLRLSKLDDERYSVLNGDFFVQEAVDRVLFRTYSASGEGGLFPLKGDFGDQKCVEIWYQMNFWLGEHLEI